MRWLLFTLSSAMTLAFAVWAVDLTGSDALSDQAIDSLRVAFAVGLLGCWLPMVIATFYAFRCAALERRVRNAGAMADRARRSYR